MIIPFPRMGDPGRGGGVGGHHESRLEYVSWGDELIEIPNKQFLIWSGERSETEI